MAEHFTSENDKEIADLYRAGWTTYALAEKFGVSPTPIRRVLSQQGVEVRPSGKLSKWLGTAEQDAEVVALHRQGLSVRNIAKRLGFRSTHVSEILATTPSIEVRLFGTHARKLTDEQAERIAEEYRDGARLTDLAKRHGVTNVTLRNYLVRLGVKLRPPGASLFWTAERKAEAAQRYVAGESQEQIALSLGCEQTSVSNVLRDLGVLTRGPVPRGAGHPSWKGGRVVDGHGYVRVKPTEVDAHLITVHHNGYVLEHRLVMARALGRSLERYESVHHINGDKKDNRLENLQLRQGKHGNGVAVRCRDCGSHNVETVALS